MAKRTRTTPTATSTAPFCTCCSADGADIHIGMGTLVDAPSIRPTARIFDGSKARYFTITDGCPNTKRT